MALSPLAKIIVDDTVPEIRSMFSFNTGWITLIVIPDEETNVSVDETFHDYTNYLGASHTSLAPSTGEEFPGFNWTFWGTSASLHGTTTCDSQSGPSNASCLLEFSIIIDDGPAETITSPPVQDGVLYSNDSLPNGMHFLRFLAQNVNSTINFDYALFAPGSNAPKFFTDVGGDVRYYPILVNYTDEAIHYQGNWDEGNERTRDSLLKGDTIFYAFFGTKITILSQLGTTTGNNGTVVVEVSVDNQPPSQVVMLGNSSSIGNPQYYYEVASFTFDPVPAIRHNISIEVIRVGIQQPFCFRGFTYVPTSQSLADMPNVTSPSATPSQTSSQSVDPSQTASLPVSRPRNITAIVAGTIIPVFVLALSLLVILCICKRRKRRHAYLARQNTAEYITPYTVESSVGPNHAKGAHTTRGVSSSRSGEMHGERSRTSLVPPAVTQTQLLEIIDSLNNRIEELHPAAPPSYVSRDA